MPMGTVHLYLPKKSDRKTVSLLQLVNPGIIHQNIDIRLSYLFKKLQNFDFFKAEITVQFSLNATVACREKDHILVLIVCCRLRYASLRDATENDAEPSMETINCINSLSWIELYKLE